LIVFLDEQEDLTEMGVSPPKKVKLMPKNLAEEFNSATDGLWMATNSDRLGFDERQLYSQLSHFEPWDNAQTKIGKSLSPPTVRYEYRPAVDAVPISYNYRRIPKGVNNGQQELDDFVALHI